MHRSKRQIQDLAIFGGPALFQSPLIVGRPYIGNTGAFVAQVHRIFENQWLTNNGPVAQEFERALAARLGVKHCIVTANATMALQIAIRALGLSGEIIVPAFTFIATAHAVSWLNLVPVFCDVDPLTHNIAPEQVEQLVGSRTSAILGVHLWGRPCNIEALGQIARRHRLKLIFDAAHAFGASHAGKMIGGFGDAEIFSFHATKCLNTFEGGAIATQNDSLAHQLRVIRNFGLAGPDDPAELGINGKMSEIAAAMGLVNLETFDQFVQINCRNYHGYQVELDGLPGLKLCRYDELQHCNFQYVVVQIDPRITGVSRDLLRQILWAEQVRARPYFAPGCHKSAPYRDAFRGSGRCLPATDRLCQQVLVLPTGNCVGPNEISAIGHLIRFVLANAAGIRERLRVNSPALCTSSR